MTIEPPAMAPLSDPLWDPDTFTTGFPHEQFAWLRANDPLHWHEEPDGPGFWTVTTYADVRQISRHPDLFSSHERGTFLQEPTDDELTMIRQIMLNMDPPQHTQLRKLINRGFTPRMVQRLEPHVRDLANGIIDRIVDRGRCDFVTECAAELPLLVIAEMIGVPVEDREKLFDWSNRLIGFDDPDYRTSAEDADIAITEMFAYANQLSGERRSATGAREDLISVLVDAEVDGHKLTQYEIDLFFMLLVVAGNETTRNMISHGLLALLEHPDEMARLRADRSLLPTAIEEFLRWSPPVMHFRRTVMSDTDIGGRPVGEGDKVMLFYPSANRDEAQFPRADRFDVGRTPNDHIAFGGGGPHFCLGANLARLELGVMFGQLLDRVDDIALDGEVRLLRSNFINGVKQLPIAFTAT